MSKHTPGPWELKGADLEARGVRLAVIDRPEDDAGNRNAGLDWDEAHANARLIAAAPELLAALELAERNTASAVYMLPVGRSAERQSRETELAIYRAAIAKATGES